MAVVVKKIYPYPFQGLISERGQTALLLWEMQGPNDTDIAWLSCYAIGSGIVIVETFRSGGFDALTGSQTVDTETTIDDVLTRCGAK